VKLLYAPFGIIFGVIGGLIGGQIFKLGLEADR